MDADNGHVRLQHITHTYRDADAGNYMPAPMTSIFLMQMTLVSGKWGVDTTFLRNDR